MEAVAVILEAEDLQITNVVERDHLHQTIMWLKLEITPPAGEPFLAETQSLFSNSSLPKYQAGKMVKVKFNPQDRTQVALIGSAEINKGNKNRRQRRFLLLQNLFPIQFFECLLQTVTIVHNDVLQVGE